MNIAHYDQQFDDLLDAVAADPDVTEEEYRDFLLDLSFRATAAAGPIIARSAT